MHSKTQAIQSAPLQTHNQVLLSQIDEALAARTPQQVLEAKIKGVEEELKANRSRYAELVERRQGLVSELENLREHGEMSTNQTCSDAMADSSENTRPVNSSYLIVPYRSDYHHLDPMPVPCSVEDAETFYLFHDNRDPQYRWLAHLGDFPTLGLARDFVRINGSDGSAGELIEGAAFQELLVDRDQRNLPDEMETEVGKGSTSNGMGQRQPHWVSPPADTAAASPDSDSRVMDNAGGSERRRHHINSYEHVSRYIGFRSADGAMAVKVLENGLSKELPMRNDLRNHSPTGPEWGCSGSGPAQLALAILSDAVGDDEALSCYQDFKFNVVCALPHDHWELRRDEVAEWYAHHHSTSGTGDLVGRAKAAGQIDPEQAAEHNGDKPLDRER